MKVLNPHLIHAILSEPWAISEEAAHGLSPLVANIFDPRFEFEAGEAIKPELIVVGAGPSLGAIVAAETASRTKSKAIQVITISGSLTKRSQYCGPAGMEQIGSWIKDADNNGQVDGILLKLDTPGGTVNGTEELGNVIKNTKKPIVAFVDDLCASAGYWLASNCDEIIANNTTADIGSIGVLMSFADMQPAYERLGVKFHTITAPQSTEKVKWFQKLQAGDYEDYKNNILKPLAQKFIDTVKANRPNFDETVHGNGSMFHAKDLVGTLVDSIASFEAALSRVAELANSSSNSNSAKTKSMKFPKLAKAAGVEAFESADGSISLNEELAQAVETALEQSEQNASNLQSQLDARADQSTRIQELEAQVAELEKKPGAKTATIEKESDGDDASVSSKGDFMSRMASLTGELKKK